MPLIILVADFATLQRMLTLYRLVRTASKISDYLRKLKDMFVPVELPPGLSDAHFLFMAAYALRFWMMKTNNSLRLSESIMNETINKTLNALSKQVLPANNEERVRVILTSWASYAAPYYVEHFSELSALVSQSSKHSADQDFIKQFVQSGSGLTPVLTALRDRCGDLGADVSVIQDVLVRYYTDSEVVSERNKLQSVPSYISSTMLGILFYAVVKEESSLPYRSTGSFQINLGFLPANAGVPNYSREYMARPGLVHIHHRTISKLLDWLKTENADILTPLAAEMVKSKERKFL